MIVLLGMIYGLCMGSFSLMKEVPDALKDPNGRYLQWFATVIKVPALFYLTLIVTFPSLYVFNALVGSRLTLVSVLRLLVASLAVNLAVLASLGPIVLFFSLTTKSYAFIQLLNVAAFTVAGVLGLAFLLQTLHRLTSPLACAATCRRSPLKPSRPTSSRPTRMPTFANEDSRNNQVRSTCSKAKPWASTRGWYLAVGCLCSPSSVHKWAGCCGHLSAARRSHSNCSARASRISSRPF